LFSLAKPTSSTRLMRRAVSISASALLVTTVGFIPAAGASEPDDDDGIIVGGSSGTPYQLSDEDAQMLSESMGISVAEAQQRFAGQDEFSLAVATIEESAPAQYSAGVWGPTPEYRGTVFFDGDPSPDVMAVLEALPFPVLVDTEAEVTADELESELEDAFEHLADDDGISQVSGWVNHAEGTIELEYSAAESQTGTDLPSSVSERITRVRTKSNAVGIPVSIRRAADAGASAEIVRGGMTMGGCTSGFTVFRNSTRGVLTAGHCNNTSTYVSGSSTATRIVSEHRGMYGDFQWHSTPDTTSNYIRVNSSGATRAILRQRVAAVGTSVCNYGRTRTSSSCTTVSSTSVCATDGDFRLCRMVRTNGSFTNPGDSGGPWYSGNTAYGIHFGKVSGKSTYSRIGNAEAILGLSPRSAE
jgi:hypothetical protein